MALASVQFAKSSLQGKRANYWTSLMYNIFYLTVNIVQVMAPAAVEIVTYVSLADAVTIRYLIFSYIYVCIKGDVTQSTWYFIGVLTHESCANRSKPLIWSEFIFCLLLVRNFKQQSTKLHPDYVSKLLFLGF